MTTEYAKSSEVGCSFFLLLGVIVLVVLGLATLSEQDLKERCTFERNVAVAIHNGHIITKGCKIQ